MFFSKYVYKSYLNILIELWPNPGSVEALSVNPGLQLIYVSEDSKIK